MAVMTERSGGKYPRNGRNGFDCPVPNCDRKGLKGFTTGQGVGVHMRTEHPGWWVGPTGEVHGPSEPSAPPAQANGNGNGAHDLAPAEPDPADDFERQTGFTDPRRSLPPARAATVQNSPRRPSSRSSPFPRCGSDARIRCAACSTSSRRSAGWTITTMETPPPNPRPTLHVETWGCAKCPYRHAPTTMPQNPPLAHCPFCGGPWRRLHAEVFHDDGKTWLGRRKAAEEQRTPPRRK
jgi:hypothetical protein